MTHFRLRWRKVGGHVEVVVWAGTTESTTHARSGVLMFRPEEWETFSYLLTTIDSSFIEIIAQEEVIEL